MATSPKVGGAGFVLGLVLLAGAASAEPLEDFVSAFAAEDVAKMMLVVRDHGDELRPQFFALLNQASSTWSTDHDTAVKYLVVAAALARIFEVTNSNALWDDIREGRNRLSGRAVAIYDTGDLAEFLAEKSKSYEDADDLRSIVTAHLLDRIVAAEARREAELEEQRRREREAAEARERERVARERRAKIERMVRTEDLAGLQRIVEETPRDAPDRAELLQALGTLGDAATLLQLAGPNDPELAAIEALSLVPRDDVLAALIINLDAQNADLRRTARAALQRIGPAAHAALAAELREDADADHRLNVASLLLDMHYSPATPAERAHLLLAQRRVADLERLGTPAVTVARSVLGSNRPHVVADALTVLAHRGSKADLGALVPLLDHDSETVQDSAALAIRGIYGSAPLAWIQAQWTVSPLFRWFSVPGTALLILVNARRSGRGVVSVFPTALLRRVARALSGRKIAMVFREAIEKRRTARPQVLETLAEPLTSIQGLRVGCWTEPGPAGSPRRLVVTGWGPPRIAARVSAIVCDLAGERNSPDDLILSGLAAFDFASSKTRGQRRPDISLDGFRQMATVLAAKVDAERVLRQHAGALDAMAPQILRPTVAMTLQSFAHLEEESGMVVSAEIEPDASGPRLLPYERNGAPIDVVLPSESIGRTDYEKVAREYRRSLREELLAEWERRARTYRDWCETAVRELGRVSALTGRELDTTFVTIEWNIDFETARSVRLDVPVRMPQRERLRGLPMQVLSCLGWWTLAELKLLHVPSQIEFKPAWTESCLVDALLRGCRLPQPDSALTKAHRRWIRRSRAAAVTALDAGLREHGLSAADVTIEQTVFRVVEATDETITVRPMHVRDAAVDPVPSRTEFGATRFTPRFPSRTRVCRPAMLAQVGAFVAMRRALRNLPESWTNAATALAIDSGPALDALLRRLTRGLRDGPTAVERARVRTATQSAHDPLERLGLEKKLREIRTVGDQIEVARFCHEAGHRPGALPDILAWDLYLRLDAIRSLAADYVPRPTPELDGWDAFDFVNRMSGGSRTQNFSQFLAQRRWSRNRSPFDFDPDKQEIRPIAEMDVWDIARRAEDDPSWAFRVSKAFDHIVGGASLVEDLGAFRRMHPDYAAQVVASSGTPPASEERLAAFPPRCFKGADRTVYWLEYGDVAAKLLAIVRESADARNAREFEVLRARVGDFTAEPFGQLQARRVAFMEDLDRYVNAGDIVSCEHAAARVRQEIAELVREAEGAYKIVKATDPALGIGWTRLAAMHWTSGEWQRALRLLAGSPSSVSLDDAHFPLAIAVRLTGGTLRFDDALRAWPEADRVMLSASDRDGEVTLIATAASGDAAQCRISGLGEADRQLLTRFFTIHDAGALLSGGSDSFAEWLGLVRVPNLGWHAQFAAAVDGASLLPLVTAAVQLGTPRWLRRASPSPRTLLWLLRLVTTQVRE